MLSEGGSAFYGGGGRVCPLEGSALYGGGSTFWGLSAWRPPPPPPRPRYRQAVVGMHPTGMLFFSDLLSLFCDACLAVADAYGTLSI